MAGDIDKAVANLEHNDADVRNAAVRALGKSPKAVAQHGAAIAQRLEDKNKDVREAAVEALGFEAAQLPAGGGVEPPRARASGAHQAHGQQRQQPAHAPSPWSRRLPYQS